MGVVHSRLTRRYLREVGWRHDLEEVLIVESQDALGDSLNTRVDQVQSVLARVNVANDTVVHVDEGVLSLLH